jgi:hypothetical protein
MGRDSDTACEASRASLTVERRDFVGPARETAFVTAQLRRLYDAIAREPIPPSMRALLERLDG